MPNLGIWSVFLFSFLVVRWERGTKPDKFKPKIPRTYGRMVLKPDGYKPKVPRAYGRMVLKPDNTCFSTIIPQVNGTKPARYKLSIPPVHGRLVLKQVNPTISTIPPTVMVPSRPDTSLWYHSAHRHINRQSKKQPTDSYWRGRTQHNKKAACSEPSRLRARYDRRCMALQDP